MLIHKDQPTIIPESTEKIALPIESHILQKDQEQMFIGRYHSTYGNKEYLPAYSKLPNLYCFSNDPLPDEDLEMLKNMDDKGDFFTIGASGVGWRMWQEGSQEVLRRIIILDKDAMITDVYVPLQVEAAKSSPNLAGYWEKMTGFPISYLESKLGREATYEDIHSFIIDCNKIKEIIKKDQLGEKRFEKNIKMLLESLSMTMPEFIQAYSNSLTNLTNRYNNLMNRLVKKIPKLEPISLDVYLDAFYNSRTTSSWYMSNKKNNPFTNPVVFAQWKAAVTLQPITTICADIFNSEQMNNVGKILKGNGVVIKAVFLSNVEEYSPANTFSGKQLSSSFENIPHKQDAIVFRVNIDSTGVSDDKEFMVRHEIDDQWPEFDSASRGRKYLS